MKFAFILLISNLAGSAPASTVYFEAVKSSMNGSLFRIKSTRAVCTHGKAKPLKMDFYQDAGHCYVLLANIYKLNSLPYNHLFDTARGLYESHHKNLRDGVFTSKTELHRCESFVRQEMEMYHIPNNLLDCPVDALAYNWFRCQLSIPTDIKPMLGRNWCATSWRTKEWDRYHSRRGVREFPERWAENLDNYGDVEMDTSRRYPEFETYEFAKKFHSGLTEEDFNVRRKRDNPHGELPIPKRYVKEFHETNRFSPGEWTAQARCKDDEWIWAIEDALPYGITIFCYGPRMFGETRTIGSRNAISKEPTLFDCSKLVDFRPPNGTYLIGMSNRIFYNGSLDFLVAGVFLCSGDGDWSKVKNETDFVTTNGTGQIVECRPGQMVCTVELKMVQVGGAKYATDVRVGCCEAPLHLMHSAMRLVLHDKRGLESAIAASKGTKELFIAAPYGLFLDTFWTDGETMGYDYNNFRKSARSGFFDPKPKDRNIIVQCKGFIKGIRDNSWRDYAKSPIKCSDNKLYPEKNIGRLVECPKGYLCCGYLLLKKDGKFWTIKLICCPVVHTTTSICGPDGVVLKVEPAKVTCIAVSGAPTSCTTTQSFGYEDEAEFTETTSIGEETSKEYSYTASDKVEKAAYGEATIGTEVSGKAGVVEVKGTAEVTAGGSETFTTETTSTNSGTNKVSNAFSFGKARKEKKSTQVSTTTEFTVADGQRMLFYDVVRQCGKSSITSEDFIRILTPSIKCDAHQTLEHVFSYSTTTHSFGGLINLTFYGYGLEIEHDTFVSPMERTVNWDLISQGVKEKFTGSVLLADEYHLPAFNFKKSHPGLWERASTGIAYNYTFTLQWPNNYHFYRVVGRCGRWRVITNSIWGQGTGAAIKLFNEPADPASPFVEGTSFTLIGNDFSIEDM